MYDEILKQGSKIVDGLSSYKQPVFVHIPPMGAELRGGSWVVVDSAINDNGMIEMSADVNSARGGVLEARVWSRSSTVPTSSEPPWSVSTASTPSSAKKLPRRPTYTAQTTARKALAEREKQLSPIFTAIATEYADAHDRAGRMLATVCAAICFAMGERTSILLLATQERLTEVAAERTYLGGQPTAQARRTCGRSSTIHGRCCFGRRQGGGRAPRGISGAVAHSDQAAQGAVHPGADLDIGPELRAQLAASLK